MLEEDIQITEQEESEKTSEKEPQDKAQKLAYQIFSPKKVSDLMGISGGERLDNIAWHDFSEYNYILAPEILDENKTPKYLNDMTVFAPNSINLGLRIVYRQEWRPLGNQRGEIIKTIPLGPKQSEKVSTKIIRRNKIAKTAENLRSIETTTEMSETTKDSSEIVNEASQNFHWNVEAEASYKYDAGVTKGSASIKAGMGGELAHKTTATNQKLSEIMQKTASKMRNETKTVVNTESESTFELTTASEIQNPNEEIPITYVYSKLQRQYEVFTSIAEVQNVIMVAMNLPEEINFSWVKKYDWIIAKVLLDDSFRDAVSEISMEPDINDLDLSELDTKLEETKSDVLSAATNINTIEGTDFLKETEGYREIIKERIERKKQDHIKNAKKERLYRHIEDNILHYMRAIWTFEDSQQRFLRIQKLGIKVPNQWFFQGVFGSNDASEKEFGMSVYDLYDLIVSYELGEEQSTEEFQQQLENQIVDELGDLETEVKNERDKEIDDKLNEIKDRIEGELLPQITELEERRDDEIEMEKQNIVDEISSRDDATLQDLVNQVNTEINTCYDSYYDILYHFNTNRYWPEEEFTWNVSKTFSSILTGTKRLKTRIDSLLSSIFTLAPWYWSWRPKLVNESRWLGSLIIKIGSGQLLEIKKNNLQQKITQTEADEISQQQAITEKSITNLYKQQIDDINEIITNRIAKEQEVAIQEITQYYDKYLINAREWLVNKIKREYKSGILFEGDFGHISGSNVDLIDVINPAGPIGFHGNYAIFYLKPEIASNDINTILKILKTPYLWYTNKNLEPILVDPLYKEKLKKFSNIEPTEEEKDEMLDYVPDLRLQYAIAEDTMKSQVDQSTGILDPMAFLLEDKQMFIDYYPEYLFRKELTRRFVVDTNNLILDIEPGYGSTLESFKLAHRGIDVQKAYEEKEKIRLENIARKELLLEKKLQTVLGTNGDLITILDKREVEHKLELEPESTVVSDQIQKIKENVKAKNKSIKKKVPQIEVS